MGLNEEATAISGQLDALMRKNDEEDAVATQTQEDAVETVDGEIVETESEPSTAVMAPGEDGTQVSSLVRLAIERGVDVEVLERLVSLQERVTERDARMAFFNALADFQEECPEINKSSTAQIATKSGGKYSYTYAPIEEITRTIRPALREHGLSFSFDAESGEGGVLNVICILRHVDGHEERARFPVPTATSAAMSEAQKNGAALTYGRRQSLIAVLGLTTADTDTDATDPAMLEPITKGQAADLKALAEEAQVDMEKFLDWLEVEYVEDIMRKDYDRAIVALNRKRNQA